MSGFYRQQAWHRKVPPRRDKKGGAGMTVRRLRCKQCRLYVDRDGMVTTNVGNFCSSDCLQEKMGEKRAKKKAAAKQAKRRTRPPTRYIPMDIRKAVYERDECCRWCGAQGQEVHHVIYRSQGGPDTLTNLVLLCNRCHMRAHSSKQAFQPLLLMYLDLVGRGIKMTVPQIISKLRDEGELTELQEERLAS